MIRYLFFSLMMTTCLSATRAQTGGEGVFNFLKLNNSSRSVAMGGVQIALTGKDPELLLSNPALLTSEMNHSFSINYTSYLAGIGFGHALFAKDLERYGMVSFGIQFVDYGQFVAADENGTITGSFSAADYAFMLNYAKNVSDRWTLGVSLRPIYSHLESYRSYGIAASLGMVHHSADRHTTFAFCFRDWGWQLKPYYDGGSLERMIPSIQAGLSHQLQHAPILLAITTYDLNRWNQPIAITDPNGLPNEASNSSTISMLMRHLSLGAEFFPEHKLTVRVGYNYRQAIDLSLNDVSTLAGFSGGLGINLTNLRFNYALAGYAHAGLVHHFSFTANLDKLYRK